MKSVGVKSNILKASDELKATLESAGRKRDFPPAHVLFREDGETAGVFLVFNPHFLFDIRVSDRMIGPTPVSMRL